MFVGKNSCFDLWNLTNKKTKFLTFFFQFIQFFLVCMQIYPWRDANSLNFTLFGLSEFFLANNMWWVKILQRWSTFFRYDLILGLLSLTLEFYLHFDALKNFCIKDQKNKIQWLSFWRSRKNGHHNKNWQKPKMSLKEREKTWTVVRKSD